MNTKFLMAVSAVVMALLGIITSFFPQEILNGVNVESTGLLPLLLQVLGALYIAFAMMNWMMRENILGGIYGRPVVMGNSIHFTIGAIALIKSALAHPNVIAIWGACFMYSLFALLFFLILFKHPGLGKDKQ